ncbi:MAG: helicase-related protein, partial [Parasphingopyxis sp.]
SDRFLSNPKHIEVARPATAADNIEQRLVETSARNKKATLKKLLREQDVKTAIVFSNRKTTVRDLEKELRSDGFRAGQIQGDMDQSQRTAQLQRFKDGEINILVASDVAARGLDIKGVSHIFNYDVPWHPDDYIHRIGRTGRAGATGIAITLATPADEEAVDNIEKLTGHRIGSGSSGASAKPPAEKPEESEAKDAPSPSRSSRGRSRGKSGPKPPPPPAPSEERAKSGAQPPPPPEPARENARSAPKPKPAPAPAKSAEETDDGEWNGPVPGFLGIKLD